MGKTGEEKKNRRFRDSKRAKSIARRIHRSVWFGKLWDYLVLDVVAAAMLIAIFILSCNGFTLRNADFKKVGEGTQNAEIVGTDYDSLALRIIYEDGTQKDFPIRSIGDNAVPVFLVILRMKKNRKMTPEINCYDEEKAICISALYCFICLQRL